jgi:molybdopterin converting factor subunit 1
LSLLPESSLLSSSLLFVRREQKIGSFDATQPALGRQAIDTFISYLSAEEVESSVMPNRSSCHKVSGWHRLKPVLLAPSPSAGYNSPVPPASQTIRVTVLFFGRLKELAGHAEDSIEFPDAATIEQLFSLYAGRHPELAKYRSSVVASRNQEFAAWDTPLRSGDEVAFLPPVSGG